MEPNGLGERVVLDERPSAPNVDGVRCVPNADDVQCDLNDLNGDRSDDDVGSAQLHNL